MFFTDRKYIRSLFWAALTLTTIGETESPETNLVRLEITLLYATVMNRFFLRICVYLYGCPESSYGSSKLNTLSQKRQTLMANYLNIWLLTFVFFRQDLTGYGRIIPTKRQKRMFSQDWTDSSSVFALQMK